MLTQLTRCSLPPSTDTERHILSWTRRPCCCCCGCCCCVVLLLCCSPVPCSVMQRNYSRLIKVNQHIRPYQSGTVSTYRIQNMSVKSEPEKCSTFGKWYQRILAYLSLARQRQVGNTCGTHAPWSRWGQTTWKPSVLINSHNSSFSSWEGSARAGQAMAASASSKHLDLFNLILDTW